MARAILGGLLAKGYPQHALTACSPVQNELDWMEQQFGIATSADNKKTVGQTDALVLCVKPQVMQTVCEDLQDQVQQHKPLIISIAAGITVKQLQTWLGGNVAIVRCMPNTPSQVHLGAAGLFANETTAPLQKQMTQQIFEAVGLAVWLNNEADLHGITALSGSGPAYCLLFLDAMETAARKFGLSETVCHKLAVQTMLGAAELAKQSELSPDELKRKVMSPGGTTERAISTFEQLRLTDIVGTAMYDAWIRSYELAGDDIPGKTNKT